MKTLLLLLLSVTSLQAQTLKYETDSSAIQDEYKLYYSVRVGDSVEIPIAVYKYNYTIREKKSTLNFKLYNLDSTIISVRIQENFSSVTVKEKRGPATFMLVIWLKKKYYLLYFDNYQLTKIIT